MTFEQFLTNSAQQGHINAVFEQRMFHLKEDLGRLLELFKSANSLRPKDVVHLEVLDEVGFITPELEQQLPPALQGRLREARAQFEKF